MAGREGVVSRFPRRGREDGLQTQKMPLYPLPISKRGAYRALSRLKQAIGPHSALGRSQAVRHRFLVPACGGSNPPAPAILFVTGALSRRSTTERDAHSNLRLSLCLTCGRRRGGSDPPAPAILSKILMKLCAHTKAGA